MASCVRFACSVVQQVSGVFLTIHVVLNHFNLQSKKRPVKSSCFVTNHVSSISKEKLIVILSCNSDTYTAVRINFSTTLSFGGGWLPSHDCGWQTGINNMICGNNVKFELGWVVLSTIYQYTIYTKIRNDILSLIHFRALCHVWRKGSRQKRWTKFSPNLRKSRFKESMIQALLIFIILASAHYFLAFYPLIIACWWPQSSLFQVLYPAIGGVVGSIDDFVGSYSLP